jgi:probable HAF family extracellular repeat protein
LSLKLGSVVELFKEESMNSRLSMSIAAMTVFAALATPIRLAAQDHQGRNKGHARYTITDLGSLGGTSSEANGINNKGWVTGQAKLPGDQTGHAFLWQERSGMTDLGTLGGPNSAVFWPVKDDRGLIAGISDTSNTDPLGENFCGFGTGLICLGFQWRDGTMSPLPTLGGNNSYATAANNRGQVVGLAENSTQDPNCIAPQVLDWEAVIWGPKLGEMHELPPLSGDSIAGAIAINDRGQVVGGSGFCGPVSSAVSVHAVLWQNGSPIDLGNLGGALNNVATGINSRGEVIGFSDLAGDATEHAFLWTDDDGMQDLGTLSGDVSSSAFGINEEGQVAGQSCDQNSNCRAFLWEDGVITDLNTLVCPGSSLSLTYGGDINDRGEIVGQAFDQNTGDTHAFLAVPGRGHCNASSVGQKVILPENVRKQLQQRRGFGRF